MKSPRARKRARETVTLVVAVGTVVLLAIVVGVGLVIGRKTNPQLGTSDLCRKNEPVAALWAVIIDVTDSLNLIQRTWIKTELQKVRNTVPENGLLAVFPLRSQLDSSLVPAIALCNPGTGESLSIWWSNPEMLRRRWEEEFKGPIDRLLDSVVAGSGMSVSPLMRSIQAVNVSDDFRSGRSNAAPRALFVFSDLLEHTPEYSHYSSTPPIFSDLRTSPLYSRIWTDLAGVKVYLYYVSRDSAAGGNVQGRHHIAFWEQFFSASRASVMRVLKVEG